MPVLADFRRIDINMDHFRVRRKRGQPAGDTIVETNTKRDQQVGMGHAHIGRIAAVHAWHADEIRMIAGKSAQPH